MGYTTYQLVQDFSHQQYYQPKQCIDIHGKSLKIAIDLYWLIPQNGSHLITPAKPTRKFGQVSGGFPPPPKVEWLRIGKGWLDEVP